MFVDFISKQFTKVPNPRKDSIFFYIFYIRGCIFSGVFVTLHRYDESGITES